MSRYEKDISCRYERCISCRYERCISCRYERYISCRYVEGDFWINTLMQDNTPYSAGTYDDPYTSSCKVFCKEERFNYDGKIKIKPDGEVCRPIRFYWLHEFYDIFDRVLRNKIIAVVIAPVILFAVL